MLGPLLLVLWLFPCVLAAVGMPRNPQNMALPDISAPPNSIIDCLSGDAQYSYFLRHIQRHGLVPQINEMANVTLFAPVNSAFVDSELAKDDSAANLLRYFASSRFRVSYLNGSATVLDSLYVAKTYGQETRTFPLKIASSKGDSIGPYKVNDVAEILEWDGYAKHQRSFIQAIDHLLPSAVSMCGLLMDSKSESDNINGHAISFVKTVFQSVFTQKKQVSGESYMSCDQFMANVSTVLLPTDRYINNSLSGLQKRYLLTIHHGIQNPDLYPTKEAVREMRQDILDFLSTLFLPDLVGGINGTSTQDQHTSKWGKNTYNVSYDQGTDRVNINDKIWSVAGSTSLTLADGILHLFDMEDPQNPDFFSACNIEKAKMIPRKTLYAMHFSSLVRELKFYKKAQLIGESAQNQTILVDVSDRDDFFDEDELSEFDESSELFEEWDVETDENDESLHKDDHPLSISSFSSRSQILYKFIDGFVDIPQQLTPENPRFHELFNSKLCSKKRIGSCFKVKISGALIDGKLKMSFNDRFQTGPPEIAEGNNSIYVLETDFVAPQSFKNVMASLISDGDREYLDHVTVDKSSCLQTLKYLDNFDLISPKENYHGYSIFLPCGSTVWDGGQRRRNKNYSSWNSLGLILKYLESHPKVFKDVLRGNFLEDLIYSDFGLEDSRESFRVVKTLSGDSVNVSETYQQGEHNHVISINRTELSIPLNSDVLFNQGVVHVIQKVLLPDNFQISLKDLVQAEHGSSESSFVSFIEKFPKLANVIQLDDPLGSEYSLLVPTTESLRSFNITTDFHRLLEFLELHLITNSDAQTLLRCMGIPYFESGNQNYTIQTNKTRGSFSCRTHLSSGKTYLTLPKKDLFGLASDGERQVRVVNYGCSQQGNINSSCVFLLDRPLDLTWFDPQDNFLHVHLGWISVGIGIVIGVILFGFCTTTVALCLSRSGAKKPRSVLEPVFKPAGSSYMPITSDEDLFPENYDYGYETDVDLVRNEVEPLLPKNIGRRPPVKYGSSSPLGAPSAPRKIRKQGPVESIPRERALPTLNIG